LGAPITAGSAPVPEPVSNRYMKALLLGGGAAHLDFAGGIA